jgi:hypothetical protein
MANIKISQLTPKGANLASTDLLEISESAGGGTYVTKSVTGAQIVAAGGGVTSVSGTAPIASTGGTTPTISIATANTSTTGALTSTDWNTFNGKQAPLVSGTNIKTINGSSVLGSGNITISGGGTNPTSGFIPINNSGVFANSKLQQIPLGPSFILAAADLLGVEFSDFGGQNIAQLNGSSGPSKIGPNGFSIGCDFWGSAFTVGQNLVSTGTHTTISKWLRVTDENFDIYYIPLYL